MSRFDELDTSLLTNAIDHVFSDPFSYVPILEGTMSEVDVGRGQRISDIPVVKETVGEIERARSRAGGGKETKFHGRFSFETIVLDADRKYFTHGIPQKGDLFRSKEGDYFRVDHAQTDGTRYLCVVGLEKRKKS